MKFRRGNRPLLPAPSGYLFSFKKLSLMAFDANNSRFLLWLISRGEKLGDIVTVGRLGLFLPEGTFESDSARFGIHSPEQDWGPLLAEPFCDSILSALGATSVSSLDFSTYEGANVIHDLNRPIPVELHERYDVLFDSGSLEHVFNVPTALQNYVHLIRQNGLLVLDLPVDGCSGHGFFQFSPELFYRYFGSETGCRVEAMFCVENLPGSTWYKIPDPTAINRRVEIVSSQPVHLLVAIRRVEIVDCVSSHFPSQADYEIAWAGEPKNDIQAQRTTTRGSSPGLGGRLKGIIRKFFGMRYHRFSVNRNARRERRDFQLGRSAYLPPFDPFKEELDTR